MSSRPTPAGSFTRRRFLAATGGIAFGAPLLGNAFEASARTESGRVQPAGPGAGYRPRVDVTFVRRKSEYGMRWPGAVYDGKAALERYRTKILEVGRNLGMDIRMREAPIHSHAEADAWVAGAATARPDGLMVVLLDRQEHSWPTAKKAAESGIPTVIFCPVGAAFTTNTWSHAHRDGVFIASTDDFEQAAFGMRMLWTAAKLREMRFVVLRGDERRDLRLDHFGTRIRYVPARHFLEEYEKTPTDEGIEAIAREYLEKSRGMSRHAEPSKQDVLNGVKSYEVARRILEREEADGISMDCLGALGHTKVSLPCIAWSRMLDHGIPAACEADLEACATHALTQFLLGRPGFQQDPVPETSRGCLIGAHCTCPTRLEGFDRPQEKFELSHHHGMRDAVPKPLWRVGQRATVAHLQFTRKMPYADELPDRPQMIISSGTVVENVSVPPSGGCVVSVMLELDGVRDVLAYPGFHQLFLYGDFQEELLSYCRLFGIDPVIPT